MSNDPLKALFEADAKRVTQVPAHDPAFQVRVLERITHKRYRQQQIRLALKWGLPSLAALPLIPYLADGFSQIDAQDVLISLGVMLTLPAFILLFRKGLRF
ncbi:MAG: hypothetical protein QM645_03120 [Asticcacaulis sp.]